MKTKLSLLLFLMVVGNIYGLIGYGESAIFTITNPTLPVELSSFAAIVTSQSIVSVQWTSQSETDLIGYRVYRSQSPVLAGALLLTPICIASTNTSQPCSYAYQDEEVEENCTYHYWLESLDYAGSNFYGPASVTVTGSESPPLPDVTLMRSIYPNPFQSVANIEIDVKGEETAQLGIYNLAGQLVKSLKLVAGSHKLIWDGRDSRGRTCASGIYLARLSSPSYVSTAKLVFIK